MATLGASPAGAQSDQERAAARVAAKEGIKAFKEQRWEDSLKYLERAESVVHAPTHLLFIARARVKVKNYVEAREAYQKLINENLDSSAPQAFHNAQGAGREEIQQIEGKIASLRIIVQGPDGDELKNVVIKIDGAVLSPAFMDLPVPSNPGERKITATADGMQQASQSITLEEGGSGSVTLAFERAAVVAAPLSAPAAQAPEKEEPPPAAAPPAKKGNARATIGWISIGTGVALGGAGGALWAISSSNLKNTTGDGALCEGTSCNPAGMSKVNDAQTMALLGDVAIGVGVGAIGLGTILLITGTTPSSDVGVRNVVPVASKDGGYLAISGGF